MDATQWAILIALIVLVLIVIGIVVVVSRRRSATGHSRRELRERFGPEYDRQVERAGGRRQAEQHLAAVADRRDALDIRELTPDERSRWTSQWQAVQVQFVDSPREAVAAADSMLTEVLRTRGYPIEDFDDRASLVAADHPGVVEHYRAAHAAHERFRTAPAGGGDTEDLRQSFVHYRALFEALVGGTRTATGPDRREPGETGHTVTGGPVTADHIVRERGVER